MRPCRFHHGSPAARGLRLAGLASPKHSAGDGRHTGTANGRKKLAARASAEIKVFEDRITSGEWRVEYFDDGAGCYVAIFAGPAAEQRARDYRDALSGRLLTPVSVTESPN